MTRSIDDRIRSLAQRMRALSPKVDASIRVDLAARAATVEARDIMALTAVMSRMIIVFGETVIGWANKSPPKLKEAKPVIDAMSEFGRDDLARHLDTMRRRSNDANHNLADADTLTLDEVIGLLEHYMLGVEWGHCDFEFGPHLTSIYEGALAVDGRAPSDPVMHALETVAEIRAARLDVAEAFAALTPASEPWATVARRVGCPRLRPSTPVEAWDELLTPGGDQAHDRSLVIEAAIDAVPEKERGLVAVLLETAMSGEMSASASDHAAVVCRLDEAFRVASLVPSGTDRSREFRRFTKLLALETTWLPTDEHDVVAIRCAAGGQLAAIWPELETALATRGLTDARGWSDAHFALGLGALAIVEWASEDRDVVDALLEETIRDAHMAPATRWAVLEIVCRWLPVARACASRVSDELLTIEPRSLPPMEARRVLDSLSRIDRLLARSGAASWVAERLDAPSVRWARRVREMSPLVAALMLNAGERRVSAYWRALKNETADGHAGLLRMIRLLTEIGGPDVRDQLPDDDAGRAIRAALPGASDEDLGRFLVSPAARTAWIRALPGNPTPSQRKFLLGLGWKASSDRASRIGRTARAALLNMSDLVPLWDQLEAKRTEFITALTDEELHDAGIGVLAEAISRSPERMADKRQATDLALLLNRRRLAIADIENELDVRGGGA